MTYAFAKEFEKHECAVSAYLYGSYRKSPEKAHDIDILVIIKDDSSLSSLSKLSAGMRRLSKAIELTTVTESEARYRIHQSLSSFYYLNLYMDSECIYGKNILKNKPVLTLDELSRRVAFITQRLRNALVDDDKLDIDYYKNKLDKWIPYFVQEAVYLLYRKYEKVPSDALAVLKSHNKSLKWFRMDSDMHERVKFLQQLENFLLKKGRKL